MYRKGISQIVATVLLIGMALAGTATVYQLTSEQIDDTEQYTPNIKLTEISMERCNTSNSRTTLYLRNSNTEAINTSLINVYIDGEPLPEPDYSSDPEIVDPQRSFTIELDTVLSPYNTIKLATTRDSIEKRCLAE